MTTEQRSPEAQAILDEMKPLGEWLMQHRAQTRVMGRMQYAKEHGYDGLAAMDKEYDEKYARFSKLEKKYRALRKREMKGKFL